MDINTVLATPENMVLAFEITFLPIIRPKSPKRFLKFLAVTEQQRKDQPGG